MPTPRNVVDAPYQPEQQLTRIGALASCKRPPAPAAIAGLTAIAPEAFVMEPDLLAPGDRLRLDIAGDKDLLTGTYIIPANGVVSIGGTIDVSAAGRARAAVAEDLRQRLVAQGLVRDIAGNVHLHLTAAAPVMVSVEGAVFQPGQALAGDRGDLARNALVANPAGGDFNSARTLSSALRAAGGVRPDASLSAVYLLRGNRFTVIDESATVQGGNPVDPQVAAGDRIVVGSAGCFQPELVRPTNVTAPGIRVYFSNLTRPAAGNAVSAINKDTTGVPYGTRFLQGLVSANCVGGSLLNAQRRAVLISRNPITGRSVVIQRSIEHLVRDAGRDEVDPYLMPGDAVACYDSTATSIADVIGLMGSVATPAALVKSLTN